MSDEVYEGAIGIDLGEISTILRFYLILLSVAIELTKRVEKQAQRILVLLIMRAQMWKSVSN